MPAIERQHRRVIEGVIANDGDMSNDVQPPLGMRGAGGEVSRIANGFHAVAETVATRSGTDGFLDALINDSADAIISMTLQGVVKSWNPAAETIYGYSGKQMIGRPLSVLIRADRVKEEAWILAKIKRGERVKNHQTVRRHQNGKLFPVSVTVSPIRDMSGTITGIYEIARDISEYVKTADAQKRAEQRYELVLLSLSVGVWDWDLTTNKMYQSRPARIITGDRRPKSSETMDSYLQRVHPKDKAAVRQQLQAHLDGRGKYDIEYRLRKPNREYVWIRATGQAVYDKFGKAVRIAGSIADVSARKALELQLQSVTEKLQRSNQELVEFAYAASHDLKAPLRVIHNAAMWLFEDLEPFLTDEMRENMGLLRSRVKRMEKLLDDLLEYSRFGGSPDPQNDELISGAAMLENIAVLLSPPPGFSVMAEPSFAQVRVIRMPIQQVLINLIGNAIKHHHMAAGRITLSVEDQGKMLAFAVRDDGPGIAPQYHERIFQMFQTLKPRDQVEGSGMGLAMAKKHVEAYGGKISVQSEPGLGSVFRFTWPKSQNLSEEEE
jgi:PAS domain S-box-containing protein